jgi:hypothetical protein
MATIAAPPSVVIEVVAADTSIAAEAEEIEATATVKPANSFCEVFMIIYLFKIEEIAILKTQAIASKPKMAAKSDRTAGSETDKELSEFVGKLLESTSVIGSVHSTV